MLTFSPLAWLKLRLFLHTDEVEVGFFGISAAHDLLYVEDLAVVKQAVTVVTVAFDDAAVADHFDRYADAGVGPARCGRIWVHTHPGSSPMPSSTDEETFGRVFGTCDWAVMAIVARNGASYARLAFSAGPGGEAVIPIEVDWDRLPADLLRHEGSLDDLISQWMDEYGEKIHPAASPMTLADRFSFNVEDRDVFAGLDDLHDLRIMQDEWSDYFQLEEAR